MKKKFLFVGVALTTLFAACTNEELVKEQATLGQENRPMAKVELAFNEGDLSLGLGEIESRLEFGKNSDNKYEWIFSDNDKIGGLLMDTWNEKGCGIENFTITDYVHTNYAFIRKDGKWETPENAPVCEGNYFFYFPYNDTFAHRGYVAWNVNPEQLNYNPETGEYWPLQAVKDNQKWLGYSFVEDKLQGKVNSVNFDFVPLFAMPTFDITIQGYPLKFEKLVVKMSSNNFEKDNTDNVPSRSNGINLQGKHELMATTMMLTPAKGKFGTVNQKWKEMSYAEHTSAMWQYAQRYSDFGIDGESYVWPADASGDKNGLRFDASYAYENDIVFPLNELHTEESVAMEPTYEYTVKFPENYIKGNGEHVQALLVMPAGFYAYGEGQTFEVFLYGEHPSEGDKYVIRIDLGKPQTNGGTNNSAQDDQISQAAGKFLKAGVYTQFNASVDASQYQSYEITDFKVTSTDDLARVIEMSKPSDEYEHGIYDLIVSTSGKRVVLNETIEDMLNKRPNLRLYIDGEITIGEKTSENAINLLWFNNNNIKTKLNIVNKQVKKRVDYIDPLTGEPKELAAIENCTDITISSTETSTGELDTKTNDVAIYADNVINNAILNAADIYADVENNSQATTDDITGDVENNGVLTANVIDGNLVNTTEATATVVTVTEDVENAGTLNINNAGTADTYNLENSGTLNANGGLIRNLINAEDGVANVEGETTIKRLSNYGELNINANTTTKKTSTNYSGAEINVAAGVRMIVMDRQLINWGIINVYGDLAQEIQNHSYIYVFDNGHVAVNGALNQAAQDADQDNDLLKIAGIIDITNANLETNAEAAKDIDENNMNNHNYFRYDIHAETTADELDAVLERKISAYNYNAGENDARIIVRWTSETTASEFTGVSKSNIDRVIIDKNLDFVTKVIDGELITLSAFNYLNDACWAVGFYDGTAETVETPSFVVTENAVVNVAYEAELSLDEAEKPAVGLFNNNGILSVLVNGVFKANNKSSVYNKEVAVSGLGYVEIFNDNTLFDWTNGGIPTENWVGKK